MGSIILSYFSRFRMRSVLSQTFGRFLDPKTEFKLSIAAKFDANKHFINFELLSKFHVARPNRSQVISKRMKLHTR